MQKLTHVFIVLQYTGLWRPVHWLPGWKSTLYDCYTWLMVFVMFTATLSELIELPPSLNSVETFANNSFFLFTELGTCAKVVNLLMKRNSIIELTNVLEQDPCRPNNEDELVIQRKYDNTVRFHTLSYGILVGCAATFLALTSFVRDVPHRALPYASWLPFDYEKSVLRYTVAWNHQIVTMLSGAAINVAFDTLVSGLMFQACCQLNILKYRFHKMPQILESQMDDRHGLGNRLEPFILKLETRLLSQRVTHHTEIFKFAKTANDLFGVAIFLQCAVSTVVLCVSVVELSRMTPFSTEFTSIIMYLACMLFEIFIYCFAGCELTIESVKLGDAIYEMDWSSLSIKTQASLLTIMVRTLRPIKVTTLYIVTLNLDSFNKLLKLSYSAYNVL